MRYRMLPVAGLILVGTAGMTYAVAATLAAGAQVVYVDENATGPTHDGSSWCSAFTELHEALAVATPGTTIRVAEGTYKPDADSVSFPRDATFSMLSGVRLEGGYAGCGAADPDDRDIATYETILSGDLDGDDAPVSCTQDYPDCFSLGERCVDGFCIIKANNAENAQHVVTASGVDETAVLDGFTITGGNVENPSPYLCRGGGGMYNRASPTLTDCKFIGNSATGDFACGGGMSSSGSPTLTNCTFSGNSATGEDAYGGGMYNCSHSNPMLTNCTFSGNSANGNYGRGSGGGMENYWSTPTLTDCTFSGNSATFVGGGMDNYLSIPALTRCVFSGNSAGGGGGMHNDGGNPTVIDCTFSGNLAGYGGGLENYESDPTLTNCTFSENSAVDGGGMYSTYGDPALTNCTFTGNSAGREGGGICNGYHAEPTLSNCTFNGNSAGEHGGGMSNTYGHPMLTNCTFSGNSADSDGGGMYNSYFASSTLTNCAFSDNWALGDGGGMYNTNGYPALTDCTFNGNSATFGGGMYSYGVNPSLTGCTFSSNSADYDGGGMYSLSGSPTLTDCTFSENPADYGGGGMYIFNGSPTLTDCTFRDNSANYGGGMYNDVGDSTLIDCTFSENSATRGGGMCDFRSSPALTNCTFSRNSAYFHGGGMYNYDNSDPTVANCTFAGNSATNGQALACDSPDQAYPSTVEMANCILWDGGNEIWDNDDSTITVTYSCVQDEDPDDDIVYPGEGNIDNDPLFVPGPGGCYFLSQKAAGQAVNSPSVDAGSDTAADLGLDTLSTRSDEGVDTGIVDMGFHYPVTALPLVMGDYDRDGNVDLTDFANLQGCFTGEGSGPVTPCCRIFDFQPDNEVDLADFAVFANVLTGPR